MLTQQHMHDMNEDELRKRVLMPLLKAMGYHDVFEYHGGAGEQGKDIVCWRPDDLGTRTNLAVVAKAVRLSGKASVSKGTAGEIRMQIQQCFGKRFQEPVRGEEQAVHQCWVVCNKDISKEAEDAIKSGLMPGLLERNVRFIGGDLLWELIEKYLPTQAVLHKLHEAGQVFEALDTHYRVRAHTSAAGVELGIEEKFPGASKEKPFTIHAKLAFPDTEEGHTVREAFERHLHTGAPVEIPASFAQFAFPEFFQALVGDSSRLQTLRLEPIMSPHSMLVRIDICNIDGDTFNLEYVDLKTVQAGQEEVTLTNDHQPIPTRVRLVVGLTSGLVHIEMTAPQYGMNVKQILDSLRLQQSISKAGTVRISHLDTGLRVLEVPLPPGQVELPNSHLLSAMQDFVAIQMKVGRPINLPDRDLSDDEMRLLDKLRCILHFGRLQTRWETCKMTAVAEAVREALPEMAGGKILPLHSVSSERVSLFNVEIPLGPVQYHAEQGRLVNKEQVRSQLAQAASPDTPIELRFAPGDDDVMLVEYLDWIVQPPPTAEDSNANGRNDLYS